MSADVHDLTLLTVRETAALLRQSERSIRRKVHAGLIPALRLGDTGPLRVPLTALEDHLQPAAVALVDESPTGGSFEPAQTSAQAPRDPDHLPGSRARGRLRRDGEEKS
jgi:excisionase family DNA binding protein